jgi:hypothetical protein
MWTDMWAQAEEAGIHPSPERPKPIKQPIASSKAQDYYYDVLDAEGKKERVSHIVAMGTGEPFDNYEHVMTFIRIANHNKALSIGARHITVSTSGFPEKIKEYNRRAYLKRKEKNTVNS